MSSLDSSRSKRASSDEEARVYGQTQGDYSGYSGYLNHSTYQQSGWGSGSYQEMTSSSSQAPSQSFAAPCQYVSWPNVSYPQLGPVEYTAGPYQGTSAPIVPSTPYTTGAWPNAPWPSLHPDDMETPSDTSRSTSPNPMDLTNFGVPLPDGKSWRCAYAGCTSHARFTRGCDLRKHYRRHTKSLFCRHEECPQSRDGGFSSKKDRVCSPPLLPARPLCRCPML